MSSLALTLLYLLAAVLGVVVCRSLKLPPMLGYLAAGILIGPNALALAQNSFFASTWRQENGYCSIQSCLNLETADAYPAPKRRRGRRQRYYYLGGFRTSPTTHRSVLRRDVVSGANL